MPPVPEKDDTYELFNVFHNDGIVGHDGAVADTIIPPKVLTDSIARASDRAKEGVKERNEEEYDTSFSSSDYPPLSLLLKATIFGWAVSHALSYVGTFDSKYGFWVGVFLVGSSLELTYKPAHVIVQYIFPLYLMGVCIRGGEYPSLLQVSLMIPMYLLLVGVPMSVCLHRYFSHSAFETSRPMQFVLGCVSTLAYQGGPLWWSAKHARHHRHCDKPLDPHSVVQKGFFYAFLGWTMNPANTSERDLKYNNPKLFLPELQFLDTFFHLPSAVLFTILEARFGRPFVVYSVFTPMLMCRLVTLLFNVEYHPAHDSGKCKSVDRDIWTAVVVGEDKHDLHHRKPFLAKRSQVDIPCEFWKRADGGLFSLSVQSLFSCRYRHFTMYFPFNHLCCWKILRSPKLLMFDDAPLAIIKDWITLAWMEPLGLVWNCR